MVIWKRGERSCQSWNAYSNEGRQKVNWRLEEKSKLEKMS
jgi:hypothetical protein